MMAPSGCATLERLWGPRGSSCPEHGTAPSSNDAWWAEKLAKNVKRDADTDSRLLWPRWMDSRLM